LNAIDLLMQQHRKVDDLFEKLEEAEEAGAKEELFNELADLVAIHTTIEEKVFYPESAAARTEPLLRQALEEHLSIRRIVADLLETDIEDPVFDARLAVLREQFELHVEQEEDELFPRVAKMLGEARLGLLGDQMRLLAAELALTEPRYDIAKQIFEPAPLEPKRGPRRPGVGG
jgi:hemerythrin superfamily protein